jgi:hypothetical protein
MLSACKIKLLPAAENASNALMSRIILSWPELPDY